MRAATVLEPVVVWLVVAAVYCRSEMFFFWVIFSSLRSPLPPRNEKKCDGQPNALRAIVSSVLCPITTSCKRLSTLFPVDIDLSHSRVSPE